MELAESAATDAALEPQDGGAEGENVDTETGGALRRDGMTRRLLAVADLIAIVAAAGAAVALSGGDSQKDELVLVALLSLPLWVVLFKLYGLYDRDTKRISHSSLDDLPWLFHAVIVGTLLFWGATELLPGEALSFEEALLFAGFALLISISLRVGVRALLPRALGPERVLVAGTGPAAAALIRRVEQRPEYGLAIVGLVASGHQHAFPANGIPVVGRTSQLARALQQTRAHRVVICRPDIEGDAVVEMLDVCRPLSVKVSILPDTVDAFGPATEIDEVEGVTVLGVNPTALTRTSRLVKRGFDVAVAFPLLVLFLPFCPLIALAIKLDSPGPVLFRQTRVGRGGRRFELLKFRTMVADAEQRREQLLGSSQDPNWLLLERDPRITRVGRLLRKTSLDEVPQLWNVLRGEMSLVGPRPLPEAEDARVGGRERGRLDLTPGITGLWQVLGRTRIPFAEMVKLDHMYVTNWSLWMDVRLLLKTLPAVLRGRGTN